MGQKVNPKIFRLGVFDNNWGLKYIENKISESSSTFFKAMQIKEYIKRALRFHGLRVHKYKVDLSSTSLSIKVSYTTSQYSIFIMSKEKGTTVTKKKEHLQQNNLTIPNLLSLKKNKKQVFCVKNSSKENFITIIFIFKIIAFLIPKVKKKKYILLNLLLALKKSNIYKKKYQLTIIGKKYNSIFIKKKLGYCFILYYFLKIKKNIKNKIFHLALLIYRFYTKVKKTKVKNKRIAKILYGYPKYFINNKMIRFIQSIKNEQFLKKNFLLIFFLNFTKHLQYLQKKVTQIFWLTIIRQQKFSRLYNKNNYYNSYFLKKNYRPIIKKVKAAAKTKHLIPTYFYYKKKQINQKFYKNTTTTKSYNFINYFINNLKSITDKKKPYSIFLNFQHLGTGSIFADKLFFTEEIEESIKKKIFELNRYKKNEFFEDSIFTMLIALIKTCSAQFLANYISSKLNKLVKKQRFFLNFIKKFFKLFISTHFSKINGIKIILRGRTDKKSRKQINNILVGNIGLQKLKSNISHAKATTYTKDGTIGTEVWISYKKLKNVFTTKKFKKI